MAISTKRFSLDISGNRWLHGFVSTYADRSTLISQLDVYNSDTHFSVDVVERAPSCPLLLYACLAISARHLSHTTGTVRPQVADGYHERCIEILLPVLENRGEISIDILLAATVILRFFEQISCTLLSRIILRLTLISQHTPHQATSSAISSRAQYT